MRIAVIGRVTSVAASRICGSALATRSPGSAGRVVTFPAPRLHWSRCPAVLSARRSRR